MSWNSHTTALIGDGSVFEAASIWGKDLSCWTGAADGLPLTADDIKVLLGNTDAFKDNGPTLMGTKFIMVNNGLSDDQVYSMALRTISAAPPYYLVFGIFRDGVLIGKASVNDVQTAIPPFYKAISHIKNFYASA